VTLLPVAKAQAKLLALARPLPTETLPLVQCIGRWLSDDVHALRDQPWTALSAMDGYAIRYADLPGPWTVTGESAAGGLLPAGLTAGGASRIFTGAPLPGGSDAVVIQEEITRTDNLAHLGDGVIVEKGANVRQQGSDFPAGERLLARGGWIGPAQVALAALGGHGVLPVVRRPTIALMSTGSELVEPGSAASPDQLPASNSIMLRAMLAPLPCDVRDIGIVPDALAALTEAFDCARGADIIVSTGGASVGDHDLVRPALDAAGGGLDFWKIAMRPGKPLIAGHLGRSLVLGLPGNPVSAFATAMLFLLPLVRHMAGCPLPLPAAQLAVLTCNLPAGGPREAYLRAVLEGGLVTPLSDQDSAGTRALSQSNCFIRRKILTPSSLAGDPVEIISFR
jgi:molybdopterin molybdotransferase